MEQAIRAARHVAPGVRLLAMMTVDEDGNCLDGASAETAAAKLTGWAADAIGCNCSAGPATVLSVIERMRQVTTLPLAAMPNAGIPRAVDGRTIYLTSPEYMASFTRKLVKAGARPSRCGWITDQFGLSWQIVPRRFVELIRDKDPKKVKAVIDAMMKMAKLDVAALERAYAEA